MCSTKISEPYLFAIDAAVFKAISDCCEKSTGTIIFFIFCYLFIFMIVNNPNTKSPLNKRNVPTLYCHGEQSGLRRLPVQQQIERHTYIPYKGLPLCGNYDLLGGYLQ